MQMHRGMLHLRFEALAASLVLCYGVAFNCDVKAGFCTLSCINFSIALNHTMDLEKLAGIYTDLGKFAYDSLWQNILIIKQLEQNLLVKLSKL